MFPRAAVVILCALLATIATVAVLTVIRTRTLADSAGHVRVANDISVFRSQLEEYRKMNGSFPTSEQGLQALVREQLLGDIPPDSWNTPYIYRSPGMKNPSGYDLFSAGPDRKPDTPDDDWGEPDLTNR
jgi:general secretion pathway protein G